MKRKWKAAGHTAVKPDIHQFLDAKQSWHWLVFGWEPSKKY